MQKINKKIRIGVLMGGKSIEREVSFNSGRTVCDHIDSNRYEVIPIFQSQSGLLYLLPLKFLHRGKIADFQDRLDKEAPLISWDKLKTIIDFMYIAVHGRFAEDGTLQGALEILKIPYLGSKLFASAAGMDKIFQKKLLARNDVIVPSGFSLTAKQVETLSEENQVALFVQHKISFPVIVKPSFEGSSLGISIANLYDELKQALREASWKKVSCRQSVIVEELIIGMEFSCIALQNSDNSWRPLPITEVIPENGTLFHDYEQKYMPGRATKITPARCCNADTKRIHDACIKVGNILGFSSMLRIDGFLTKDGQVVITDPNTLSGMGPASFFFHQAAEVGIDHTQLINYLVDSELERYGLFGVKVMNKQNEINKQKSIRKRMVVLFGGDSNEREISLESGRNICYKLSPSKYDVVPVFIDNDMNLFRLSPRLLIQNSTRDITKFLTKDIQIQWSDLPQLCDFVFIGLHGGVGENGSVQGMLEMLGLPYNGSGVLASALCMDKYKTNKFLKKEGFFVSRSCVLSRAEWEQDRELILDISFPCIVKPHDDGCSMYVKKVENRQSLQEILKQYFSTEKDIAFIEEYIDGMELTCGVIGNEDIIAFPPSQALAAEGILSIKEKFLPGAGENQTPAPLSKKTLQLIQKTVEDAYHSVGCKGYARIDCFYQDAKQSSTKKERVVILEINTLPGLTPATVLFHQSAEIGMKPMELIDKIIELGFENHSLQTRTSNENIKLESRVL